MLIRSITEDGLHVMSLAIEVIGPTAMFVYIGCQTHTFYTYKSW